MCGRFHKGHVSSGDQPSAAVVGMSLAYPMMNSALWSPRRGDEAKATRSSSPAARPRRSDLEQRSDHSLPPDGSRLDTHAGRCHMNASDFDAVIFACASDVVSAVHASPLSISSYKYKSTDHGPRAFRWHRTAKGSVDLSAGVVSSVFDRGEASEVGAPLAACISPLSDGRVDPLLRRPAPWS